jgi:cation transport ATPase
MVEDLDVLRRLGQYAMSDMLAANPLRHVASPPVIAWLQLVLATPVVLRGGWPFFERAWASVVNRSLNMFPVLRQNLIRQPSG